MNAQKQWKIAYHCWKEAKEKFSNFYESDKWANEMNFIRREAALERRIAAQQRTIEAQARELNQYHRLQADIDMGIIVLEMPREEEAHYDPA